MAKRSVRAYVELASGLGEMTRARAVEAAQEIVALAGSKGSSGKVAKQVEKLAGDLLTAAEQNRAHVVGLVQREVESAVDRVDVTRIVSEVQTLGATVAGLAAQVDELARSVGTRAGRAPHAGLADVVEPVLADPPALATTAPARKAPARKAPARKAPAKRSTRPRTQAVQTAKKSAAKRTAKTTTTAKTAATKAPAKKAATTKAAAQKAPATKAPAKKTAAKKTPAKKTPAKKTTTAKASATKKTTTAKKTAKKAGA
ncbi:hypothetical protein [Phycicoccus avicenniae]|uniref:hypothetical protein n=1 Tax=Phycicoccus avicenniae TaxID=2828860 RepID=UPI003D2A3B9C